MIFNRFLKHISMTKNAYILFLPIVLLLIFRLLLLEFLPFSADEAYHWEWSRHLDLSYYDHPPMAAWLIAIINKLFGTSRFTVRLTAFFCSMGAMLFIYHLTRKIASKAAAVTSLYLFLSVPIYTAFFLMITTDPPLLFFWAASLYTLYVAIFEKEKYWLLAGVFVGSALLCKFLAVHLITALLLFILLSKLKSNIFKSKYFYLFWIIVSLIFSPVLYWNMNHHWATFFFNFSKRHTLSFEFKYVVDYLLVQIAVTGFSTTLLMLFSVVPVFKGFELFKNQKKLFLLCFTFVILAFFFAISFSRRVGAHWPVPGYLSFIVLASISLANTKHKIIKKICISFPIFLSILLSIVLLFAHKVPPTISYGYQKKATTKRLIHFFGWKEAAQQLNHYLEQMPPDSRIIGESYGVASMMALYSGRQVYSHVLNLYGIHGLNYYFWDTFEKTKGINGIYVTSTNKEKNPALTEGEQNDLKRAFSSFEIQEPLKIFIDGRHRRTFLFVKCYNLKAPLTKENPIH